MSSPLVAIVMPAYNAEATIGAAIESVLAQTHKKWFLSICDDGSGSKYGMIDAVQPYSNNAPNIIMRRHSNCLGPSAARNTAYALRPISDTTAYVLFLDADDTLAPDALERLIALAERTHLAGAVFGDIATIDAEGSPCPPKYGMRGFTEGKLMGFPDIIDGGIFPPSRVLLHRWVVDAAGPWDANIAFCEDHDFFARCALHAPFVYAPGVVANYRCHAGNTTDRTSREDVTKGYRWGKHDGYRAASKARGERY